MLATDTSVKLGAFLRTIFGTGEGFLCVAIRKPGQEFEERFLRYPDEGEGVIEIVHQFSHTHNIWFTPMLLDAPRRRKEHVCYVQVLWADLDTCQPKKCLIQPSISVCTSPNRYQAFWKLDGPIDPSLAEDLSRRIAYRHADEGADKSGWDLTQLLRVPYTQNHKYATDLAPPPIQIVHAVPGVYTVEEFEVYPKAEGFYYGDIEMGELPSSAEDVLKKYRTELHPNVWMLMYETPDEDWSKSLWNLQMLLFESKLSREEVFVVAREASCNKYRRDKKSDHLLWKEVCRAWSKVDERTKVIEYVNAEEPIQPLLSDEERAYVEKNPSFVEEYTNWAKNIGDAAWQYHQAGAFVCLSSLLAGSVRLPTSFGVVIPNLWFMILADTTLTRKSTAMDLAVDLLLDVDSDCVLATDGSIEGLFTSLSVRPGRPSIFLRDEFSGLLEAMSKKDYYAGMAETLTKLYDGKFQKRVLRKDIIEVRDPVLVMFAGGIKSKILSLLNYDHVSSGFIPRFVIITAESDISRLRPLGPPTDVSTGAREKLVKFLTSLQKHYIRQQIVTVAGKVSTTAIRWDAQMTQDAWNRYNKIEAVNLQLGLNSDLKDVTTPMLDRLSKSGLKAATLLAASRQLGETVTIEEHDIVRAFYYIEKWRLNSLELLQNIGKGSQEKQIELVYNAIKRQPNVLRSTLMQNYHLTRRDADMIFETLDQRGLISRVRSGKTERLTAL